MQKPKCPTTNEETPPSSSPVSERSYFPSYFIHHHLAGSYSMGATAVMLQTPAGPSRPRAPEASKVKRSLARMVSTAMQNERLKQQAKDSGTACDQEAATGVKSEPVVDAKPTNVASGTASGPRPRFSPPPVEAASLPTVSPPAERTHTIDELSNPLHYEPLPSQRRSSEPTKSSLGDLCVDELRRRVCEQLEREKAYETLVSELEKQRLDMMRREQSARARIAELEAEGVRMAAWAASLRGVADRSSIEVLQLRNDITGLQRSLQRSEGRLHRGEELRCEVMDDLSAVLKRLAASPGDAAGSAVLVDMVLEKISAGLD
ncbi:hypothetical protein A1Q2_00979 [Trichosporon asahii var. asahii CBS 8904]|uniref:Uncharacterized protein n=1 Tax=Trichosporon asahii var. asahii (strain CBS 8904) TaxID=1220162 RepID=K1WV98_TRIAC|nr:hypothetical protein A1Q2_00979 [Trichosporon asahii var. asahii CBS 8904]